MKVKRKIIEIDEERCDGCGQCVPACAEGAMEIVDGKAKVIADKYCDGLGACLGECPNDALHIVEREAEEFDEEAVEELLEQKAAEKPSLEPIRGCPSAGVQVFAPPESGKPPAEATGASESALSHWPVQIRLVPPDAPFLKGADLLVVADCAPLAYPNFHSDFLRGRVVMMGCPKFDAVDEYVEKFTQIFKNAGLKSITSVYMEVPCCSALPTIVKKAMKEAGREIPFEEVVVGRRGKVVERRKVA